MSTADVNLFFNQQKTLLTHLSVAESAFAFKESKYATVNKASLELFKSTFPHHVLLYGQNTSDLTPDALIILLLGL